MSLVEELDAAARAIGARTRVRPRVAVVLGSGLGAVVRSVEDGVAVPFSDIPHFPRPSVEGHRGELVLGTWEGVPLAVLSGRVHCYEGYSQAEVALPVRALGRLGVRTLIVTNAAGGINPDYRPGDLMVIEDHINMMGGNPAAGPNEEALGPRFFDMSEAYDPALRELAARVCAETGPAARRGVYIAFVGPSYETPAEIRMARALGADAVGMSTVPEVVAARHMGMRVLGFSCITNMAAGVSSGRLDHGDVLGGAAGFADRLSRVLPLLFRQMAEPE